MKKMLLGICYLLISHGLSAQQIAGHITDASNGGPVASATVELSNIATVSTNESGRFVFTRIKQGRYTLRITSIGYQSTETTVSPGDSVISIKLNRLNLFMQPVEVRAIRAGEKAPFAKTDLTKKEIEKVNTGQDLPFILNQTPSAVVSSDAGNGVGYTGIRIRGTDGTRINVTLNGIPYNDAESQGSYFVDLPDFTSSVNNIQIQRGVGTSSNGSGAFGATINLSTNEVNTTPYGEINNSVGSFNTWKHTIKAGSGLISDHFTIDARLSKISSDGFVNRGASDLRSFYLSGAYLAKQTSVRFNVISGKEKTYQSWNGVPEAKLYGDEGKLMEHYNNNLGTLYFTKQDSVNLFTSDPRKYNYFTYANQTDNFQQDHYQLFFNHQFSPNLTVNTAFFLTKGKGYYEEFKPQEKYSSYGLPNYVVGGNTFTKTDLTRQLWLENDYYGQIFSVQYKSTADQFTVGGGWNRFDNHHHGEILWTQVGGVPNDYRWYNLEAYKTDVNAYAKYQHTFSPEWEVFADMQYRRVLYDIGGFRKNPTLKLHNIFDFFNPKAGITYTANNYQAYISYAQGNKEPNRDDFEAGVTQQPKAEKLHDFEAGVSKKGGNQYEWSANLYYMLYKDQLVQTGKINDVGGYTRTNVDNSFRMGIELQGRMRFTQWLQGTANITFSRNRIKDFTEFYDDYDNGGQKAVPHGNTDIAFSPAVVAGGSLNFLPAKDLEISLPVKYVGRQYLDNTSNKQRSLDAYYVQDARVIYTLRKLLVKEISLIGQVNNVFNRKYNSNGYTYSYQYGTVITENFYFPMAGTNFMVTVNIKL